VVYRATIGRFEIASLQVWPLQQMPASEVLSGADDAGLEACRARLPQFFGDDASLIELTQNILVIRSPEQIVLVDTGEPLSRAGAILEWGLASLGIAPHEIDLVFLTHRDSDHVGGTVNLHGEPLYPRAQYLISRFEYEQFKREAKRADQFRASIEPLEDRGLLEFFEDGAEIVAGLTAVSTPGHRSGASSLRVEDGDEAALFLADTLHLPVQITHPECSSVWDTDAELAARTRHRIVEQAESEGLLLAVPHSPFGGLGRVRLEDGKRVWSPLHR
jgi:glyoxylase-like metal-dependent hydrolase (beta-lactamase superfamily II)